MELFVYRSISQNEIWRFCRKVLTFVSSKSERLGEKPNFLAFFTLSLSEGTEGYRETSNAFIFSLRNNEQLGPFKSMVKESSHAIYNWKYTGPAFGKTDIRINYTPRGGTSGSSSHLGSSYCAPSEVKNPSTVLAGTTKFDPDEVEVFFLKTLN